MKINLGSSRLKSSYFPISLDSSTSTNFGEVVPTFCQYLVPESSVNIDLRSGVRFAPLTLPTFGKAFLHSYAFHYNFRDLWKPFDDFLARTPYTSVDGTTYVPSSVPYLTPADLWFIVCAHSLFSIYDLNGDGTWSPDSSPLSVDHYIAKLLTPSSFAEFARGFVMTLASVSSRDALGYLSTVNRNSPYLVYPESDICCECVVDPDKAITPAGSDFMFVIRKNKIASSVSGGVFTYPYASVSDNAKCLVCLKLNNSGKFLRKIFLGLGYQLKRNLNSTSNAVCALPIFAFYKAYFDTFAPKRFVKFDQSAFGRVLYSLNYRRISLSAILFGDGLFGSSPLSDMIDDLLSCYYTEDTDFYSSQIDGLVNDYGVSIDQTYYNPDTSGEIIDEVLSNNGNLPPSINFENTGTLHTQSQQNILSRLTSFVNRRSLLGGKISDLLQSVFGIPKSVVDDDRPYIGSSVIDVEFSDVFSTAETSEGSLGEYAGKAVAFGSSDNMSCKSTSHGIVFVFSCLVPRTQKVQGINPCLFKIDAESYYNPMFDGLTLLPTNRYSLYCVDSPTDRRTSEVNTIFGYQSLFAEYKTKSQGILNGDLSLMSTKSTYDSFTLDQTIANYVTQDQSDDGSYIVTVTSPNPQNWSAGTMWRYVGRWLWLGNFDRIFVNLRQRFTTDYDDFSTSGLSWSMRDKSVSDDNLIIHNVVDLRINAPMLPLADSFMTRDLDELGDHSGLVSQGE